MSFVLGFDVLASRVLEAASSVLGCGIFVLKNMRVRFVEPGFGRIGTCEDVLVADETCLEVLVDPCALGAWGSRGD
jgi:hypothetical protein